MSVAVRPSAIVRDNSFRRSLVRFSTRALAFLPGIGLCLFIAGLSIYLSRTSWLQSHGVSALVIAMIVGAGFGNLCKQWLNRGCMPGISLSKQKALRLGIILYGVHLTFSDIAVVGMGGVLIDALVLVSTFYLALLFGIQVLKMERSTVVLIGAGSAICGAAAVLATEPVVRARPEQVTVAIATVVLFGTLATFLYPFLYHLNLDLQWLSTTTAGFGLYVGSTIHEVAQVVAAAQLIGPEAAHTAVIAKMVRVMMLPVFLVALSAFLVRLERRSPWKEDKAKQGLQRIAMPWFAVGFILVVALNSTFALPQAVSNWVIEFDTLLLAMAMAALGLTTHVSAFRQAGFKPIVLAAVLFIWLVGGGALINRLASF